MNSIPLSTTIVVHSDSGGNAAELVRGRVEPLIARLEPMVGIQSVTLDLGSVEIRQMYLGLNYERNPRFVGTGDQNIGLKPHSDCLPQLYQFRGR